MRTRHYQDGMMSRYYFDLFIAAVNYPMRRANLMS